MIFKNLKLFSFILDTKMGEENHAFEEIGNYQEYKFNYSEYYHTQKQFMRNTARKLNQKINRNLLFDHHDLFHDVSSLEDSKLTRLLM